MHASIWKVDLFSKLFDGIFTGNRFINGFDLYHYITAGPSIDGKPCNHLRSRQSWSKLHLNFTLNIALLVMKQKSNNFHPKSFVTLQEIYMTVFYQRKQSEHGNFEGGKSESRQSQTQVQKVSPPASCKANYHSTKYSLDWADSAAQPAGAPRGLATSSGGYD